MVRQGLFKDFSLLGELGLPGRDETQGAFILFIGFKQFYSGQVSKP